MQVGKPIALSVDLPLSEESKRVLKYGEDEADRLQHQHFGTQHLLLAWLREEKSSAARRLSKHGA